MHIHILGDQSCDQIVVFGELEASLLPDMLKHVVGYPCVIREVLTTFVIDSPTERFTAIVQQQIDDGGLKRLEP